MARHIDDRPDEGYTPTTTHAEFGAGNPRLRVTRDGERSEFAIDAEVVRIGSAPDLELRLDGADAVHATITHDERDEYVLELHGEGEMNTNPDADATHPGERVQTLRTGARFTVGAWELVFARDEFADHGRPYGGRLGGEYSDQPLQPSRPDYSDEATATMDETPATDSTVETDDTVATDDTAATDENQR
ncbi:FHA domain-containing protein [uncultured Microbacterium sp.]|uniref:FHA domain-containing protein n=1 Tax=uncultured Microbacterium sp. TaxID=191216 RepID=UPI0028D61550|nr:FHA domain-containing protein [uncultured Microbacterium sp.]